jgi:major membrane immunogen (membrane-anchored lipoprotein)
MALQSKISEENEEKIIELKDIKPGDILIFDGEDHGISLLIKKFTHSNVTHGALFMQGGGVSYLADSGSGGIHMHQVEQREKSRFVHVRRITKNGGFGSDFEKIIAPVLDIARNYVSQDLPYPYSDLVLLAMILIYKDVSDVNLKQAVIIKLLKLVTAELKTFIDEKYRDGKHTMVCSSFVYQCYLDASKNNPDLKIDIKNGDTDFVPNHQVKRSVTLLDLYADHAAEYHYNTANFAVEKDEPVKESVKELLDNLVDETNENHVSMVKGNALSHSIEEFLKALMNACGIAIKDVKDLIENAKMQQALFVTPNDLYCHTTNTESIGKLELYRYEDVYNP